MPQHHYNATPIGPYAPDAAKRLPDRLISYGHEVEIVALRQEVVIASREDTTLQVPPEMHQSKKGSHWYLGMKNRLGVDANSGPMHPVQGTAGSINDVVGNACGFPASN